MNNKQPWFVTERALALASLCLTSRQDVVVQVPHKKRNIDLLAEVIHDGGSNGRYFGVQVGGRVDLTSPSDIDSSRPKKNTHASYSIPLCAFVFDVRSNDGYFRWILEPLVTEDEPKLGEHANADWRPLNDDAIRRITSKVNAYYDALSLQLKA
jgi:hypothetical protein